MSLSVVNFGCERSAHAKICAGCAMFGSFLIALPLSLLLHSLELL